MHNGRIGSIYWQKRQQHGHRPILSMSINGASTIFTLNLEQGIFRLVADIHLCDIGSLDWKTQQRNAPCGILKMSVN